jgi:flagellar hook protein FlgE
VSPAGASAPLNLTLDFGTVTNQSTGTFSLASLEQDGFATGKLDDVSISEEGLVTATFSNGTTQALGKLAVANFSNPSGLKQRGDARWSVSGDSGDPVIGTAGEDGIGRISRVRWNAPMWTSRRSWSRSSRHSVTSRPMPRRLRPRTP